MEQELEQEIKVETLTQTEVKTEEKVGLESLPRLEDLLKTEKEIKTQQKTEIEGLTDVKTENTMQDRAFARVADEKKVFVKKRIKTITTVYSIAVSLLLAFVGVNLVTFVQKNKEINANTEIIKQQTEVVETHQPQSPPSTNPKGQFEISLNEPRDYSDDDQDLSMLDKITILFRNLFG